MSMLENPTRPPITTKQTAVAGGFGIVLATFLGKVAGVQFPGLVELGIQEVVTGAVLWLLLVGGSIIRNLVPEDVAGLVLARILPVLFAAILVTGCTGGFGFKIGPEAVRIVDLDLEFGAEETICATGLEVFGVKIKPFGWGTHSCEDVAPPEAEEAEE